MNCKRWYVLLALLWCSSSAYALQIGGITLTDLGAGVTPNAINNAGQVVGQDAAGQAFLWQNGSMTPLGTLGGLQSAANDINDNGLVVGWANDATGAQRAFKWNGSMTDLDPGGTGTSAAESINSYGAIAGWTTANALIWNSDLTTQPVYGSGSKATGINDRSELVAVVGPLDGSWNGLYWKRIPSDPTIFLGYAPSRVNNRSLTVGMKKTFRTVGGQFVSAWLAYASQSDTGSWNIGWLSSEDVFSAALGLNDNGIIVGLSGSTAFLYDMNDQTLLNLDSVSHTGDPFTQLSKAIDINDSGQFVGIGLIDGVQHGFVGQIVPEPSAVALLCIAGISLLACSFRRRRYQACA